MPPVLIGVASKVCGIWRTSNMSLNPCKRCGIMPHNIHMVAYCPGCLNADGTVTSLRESEWNAANPLKPKKCCELDTDGDGDCPIHPPIERQPWGTPVCLSGPTDLSGAEYVPTTTGGDTGPAQGRGLSTRPGHRMVELPNAVADALETLVSDLKASGGFSISFESYGRFTSALWEANQP